MPYIEPDLLPIIERVAAHYNTQYETITGRDRTRPHAERRQTAMYICKEITGEASPPIGRAFEKDSTTVNHSVKRTKERIAQSPEFAKTVRDLIASIKKDLGL